MAGRKPIDDYRYRKETLCQKVKEQNVCNIF